MDINIDSATMFLLDADLRVRGITDADGWHAEDVTQERHLRDLPLPVASARVAALAEAAMRSGLPQMLPVGRDGAVMAVRTAAGSQAAGVVVCLSQGGKASATTVDTTPRVDAILTAVRHQVINSLQLLRAVIRRTAETGTHVPTYAALLEGRLDAITASLSRAIQSPSGTVALSTLIADALEELRVPNWEARCTITGPMVEVSTSAARTLALTFHELAVNLVQHGFLGSEDEGCLKVSWHMAGDRLIIDWTEEGAAFLPGPPGFGMTVINEMLVYDLDGQIERTSADDSFTMRLILPAAQVVVAQSEQAAS